jgi:hypothetical protein
MELHGFGRTTLLLRTLHNESQCKDLISGIYAVGVAQISPGQSAAAKPQSAALGNGYATRYLL